MMAIRGVLFDLDGVLVDACEWHYLALNKALREVAGFVISRIEHDTIFNGLPTRAKLALLLKQGRIRERVVEQIWDLKQQYTTESITQNSTPDMAIISLHQRLHERGIKIACVTNSIGESAKLMLSMTQQLRYFDLLITNEMVKHPKPHAEGYIRAMVRLALMPDECLIVEDSDKGMQAAMAAGAHIQRVCNSRETAEAVWTFCCANACGGDR